MNKNIDQILSQLFAGFNPKQVRVLSGRFGLKGGECTLQEIGDELGITRERVRQIEEQAIKKVAPRVKEVAKPILEYANTYLASVGGVRRDDSFIPEIKNAVFKGATAKCLEEKLKFLFLTAGTPFYSKEDDNFYSFWYASDNAKKKLADFIKQILQVFKANDKKSLLDDKVYLAHCRDANSAHFFSISRHFGVNVFGDLGLKSWPEIEPKTVRDKAFLVLKKSEKPLHFEDIAKNITRYGIDKKSAHVQTVHNELIKDDRFVLVGRGIYGLRERGFEPGTVREVIARLLRKHGPLQSNAVISLVNQQRFLKENTILLGLQNRRHFKRLDDGRYHVKEA